MTHGYTENQIITFIYKECDLFEKLEMEFAMDDDSTFYEAYKDLLEGYNVLPRVKFTPKKSTIDAVLAYSMA